MNSFVLPFCVVAFGFAPTFAQEGAESSVGRYQVVQVMPTHFALIDTTTGECWAEDDGRWIDLKFPVKDTKVTDGKPHRFRLTALLDKEGKSVSLVVCDTVSGRSWRADYDPASMNWRSINAPRPK
jgi:hypothetical protein